MSRTAAQVLSFAYCFEALTGHVPMRWQKRLFDELMKGQIPLTVDLPTGLGKTSVVPIWLIALASQAGLDAACRLPRRLVYIVNRRTVVDQATAVVEQMRERLLNPGKEQWKQHESSLADLSHQLRALSASDGGDVLFGVSTLRGELADNEEWKADPARPAIIVGTIDMIGSKLLFSGYGDGRYGRPHHAGLIGQDALIVHDEAHLTPAFSDLLRGIADEQERCNEPRCVQVMELSATQRDGGGGAFQLQPEDETDEQTGQIVKQRLDAKKRLRLHKCDDMVAGLVERAMSHIKAPAKVLVYIRSPDVAQKVADAIRKKLGDAADERVALLTGTIRGHERDRLVREHPVYRAMLDQRVRVEHTVFLVSTSAGEVGIDIDADHLVCDLTTLDSMIQRLGRVNRRGGEGREARVDMVWTDQDAKGGKQPLEKAVKKTIDFLQRWVNGSPENPVVLVSPRKLRTLVEGLSEQEREAAFSPKPDIPPLTDILLDNWSLTSIDDMPVRPEVAAYLHGMTVDPPETYVVWRNEVAVLKEAKVDEPSVSDWFRACRIEARERLRDRTDRVRRTLDNLLRSHQKRKGKDGEGFDDFPVVLLDERGRAQWSTLSAIVKKPERNDPEVLHYRTVVLPAEAGGLDEHGMLDAKATEPIENIDIAETAAGIGRRERWRQVQTEGGESQWRRLLSVEVAERPSELRERERITLKEPQESLEDEGESIDLVLLELPAESAIENPERARFRQTLADHTAQITGSAERIAKILTIPESVQDALISAARWHDRGKDRPVWQRFARNENGAEPLAKSTRCLHGRALGGYRHEFGSLLEAMADEEIRNHPERDLILHLIAAHHGWGRPHFETRAFDHEGPRGPSGGERRPPTTARNEQTLLEAMQRFGRLQQRFGRWGLAWLESLLRCADIAASMQAAASTNTPIGSGESAPEEIGA